MAKETSSRRECMDCKIEITYCGLEAPKEPRCSKCTKALEENKGKRSKKASS